MRPSGETKVAGLLEIALLAALLVLLGVAAYKFFRMLDRTGVAWTRGLPVGVLFLGAAYLTHKRLLRVMRRLRGGDGEGTSTRHDDR